jgi:dihydroorotate dehydrogenase (NAD+) catalytic subunit
VNIKQVQLYDDQLSFEENKAQGPFGDYADTSKPYLNSGKPKYDFFGIPVYSPFGIAAGPLPTTKFINAALIKGFDIVTLKSVRTSTWPCNDFPQVRPVQIHDQLDPSSDPQIQVASEYIEHLAVSNSFGIPSVEPSDWQVGMRESFSLPTTGQALLVAFQGTAHGRGKDDFVLDHLEGVRLIRETGASIIEINLSCPNEGESVLACFDTDITERIVTAVRAENPGLKLIIKIAYFADHEQLRGLIERIGGMLDGISAINTIPAAVVDETGETIFPGRPKAGISGAPIKWAGLEMTALLKKYREEFGYTFKIIGLGGVLTASDFHEYITAGADYVMSVTGAMWNPLLAQEIKASI